MPKLLRNENKMALIVPPPNSEPIPAISRRTTSMERSVISASVPARHSLTHPILEVSDCLLDKLPAEVREKIYGHYFGQFPLDATRQPLLTACRALPQDVRNYSRYQEVLAFFYQIRICCLDSIFVPPGYSEITAVFSFHSLAESTLKSLTKLNNRVSHM